MSDSNEQKPKRTRRRYDPAEKAAALVLLQANQNLDSPVNGTATMLSLPKQRISEWAKGKQVDESVTAAADEIKTGVLQQVELLRGLILGKAVSQVESERVPFRDLMGGLKITNDVHLLLTGQPTSITQQLSPAEREKRIAELVEKARVA